MYRATVIYDPHPALCCLLMHFRAVLLANCCGNGELIMFVCFVTLFHKYTEAVSA